MFCSGASSPMSCTPSYPLATSAQSSSIAHCQPTGERATSKVFGELGLPYTQSTASSTGFADVAAANGAGNPRWYQLYWPSDDDLTRSYLRSAKANGFEVLVVTVDTWDLGWRTRYVPHRYMVRYGWRIVVNAQRAKTSLVEFY
jgi:isopentenyl diphosphate isomerase/L-lactate dehydrogenase-like FMN-dependent dehydrogenase